VDERVVITGLGVVSSLGCEIEEFWSNIVAGKSGISKITAFDTSALERHYGGEVKGFKPSKFLSSKELDILPRTHQFATVASLSALKNAALKNHNEIGIILNTISGGGEFIDSKIARFSDHPTYIATANTCKILGLKGAAFTLSCACAGGNYAISLAYERIRNKEEKIILAGGSDYFSLITFLGFYRLFSVAALKCQPFDKNRRGLIPAEGSGMLVLESLSSAKERNAHIYAEVLGYGVSADAYHSVKPSQEGIFRCMKNALENSNLMISDIDYINAHGTGTAQNDKVESQAIKKLFGKTRYRKVPVSSIKSMLGHAMGATASFEAICCCLTLDRGLIPPTINYETPDPECDIDCVPNKARKQKVKIVLNNSFGFGGMNCSVVFAAGRP